MAPEIVLVVACWTAFALVHSLTVSDRWHGWLRRKVGAAHFLAYHRLGYAIVSFLTLAAVLAVLRSLPDRPLYRIDGVGRILFRIVQLLGVALLLKTPLSVPEFLGIRQALRFVRTGRNPEEPASPRLYTGKSYAYVRHPLYLGCSAVVAFQPDQTLVSAVSSVCILLYFYIGTFHEEARLVRVFGDEYRAYRRRVPRFLPIPLPCRRK
jgi:protein-S-isoprenylcysteine O-methyltransferase Ste14